MSDAATIAGAAAAAAVATALAAPVAIRVARRTSFYDHPTGYKRHASSTPYLGGTALFAGTALAAALFARDLADLWALLACAAGLLVVGTVDDRLRLGIGVRLLAQVVAALVIWDVGLGWQLGSEVADFAFTVAWVVGLVNAFNLFDNSDGAAAAVGGAGAVGAAALAAVGGDVALAALAAAVAGACAGFLPYNLARPSRIFLGDGGSMPLGLLVATVIMAQPTGDLGWAALPAFALLAALPILDTTLVVISRWRRASGVLSGHRDHLTHRLGVALGSPRRVAFALGVAQLGIAGIAVALSQATQAAAVAAAVAAIAGGAWAIWLLEGPRWMPQAAGRSRSRRALLGEEGSV